MDNMASLKDTLTASGGAESAGTYSPQLLMTSRIIPLTCSGFLNDIIAQLWPNINVAGGKIIKDVVEPMLDQMLPGPLANLRFVKLDFGPTPIRFSNVDVHKTELEGIKLDMDLDWDGKCDFELDASMVPKIVSFVIAGLNLMRC
jgi:hypothetical protein